MAGLAALYSLNYNSSSPWYICPNGDIIEPLDILQCLFPNEGRNSSGDNVCFVARPFSSQLLQSILPGPSDYYTPEEFVDGVVSLMMMSLIVSVLMFFTKEVWNCLDGNFRSITPSHKKMYVLANLAKSLLLGIMSLSPRYWLGSTRFIYDAFQGIEIKRCGIIYITADFVALFLVPKLPRSTMIHHITTSVMAVVVTSVELKMPGWNGLLGVAKMGIVYGLFSSAAFPVNAYLALRVVYPKARWMPALVHISLVTYVVCCTINWGLHLLWLYRVVTDFELTQFIFSFLYLVAVYFMVSDDIILIKWLIRRGSPALDDQSKK